MSSQFIVSTSTFISNDQNLESGYDFLARNGGNSEPILIEKYEEDKFKASVKIVPLFSISKPLEKQAALFTNLSFKNNEVCQEFIKEALKLSWEMGFKVALATEYQNEYTKSGFQQVERIFHGYKKQYPLLYFELSWDGINKISGDIIFPLNNKPLIIL